MSVEKHHQLKNSHCQCRQQIWSTNVGKIILTNIAQKIASVYFTPKISLLTSTKKCLYQCRLRNIIRKKYILSAAFVKKNIVQCWPSFCNKVSWQFWVGALLWVMSAVIFLLNPRLIFCRCRLENIWLMPSSGAFWDIRPIIFYGHRRTGLFLSKSFKDIFYSFLLKLAKVVFARQNVSSTVSPKTQPRLSLQ